MVCAKIAVEFFVGRYGEADTGGDEAVRLVAGAARLNAEGNLSRIEIFKPFLFAYYLASRRENGRNRHKVALFDAGVAQGEFVRPQFLLVNAYAPCKEDFFRYPVYQLP